MEHSDLMAQDQDLGVIGPVRLGKQGERRVLDQERRLLDKGSHAADWVRATAAGTFWSGLNAVDFMNSSLQFAALTVLSLPDHRFRREWR